MCADKKARPGHRTGRDIDVGYHSSCGVDRSLDYGPTPSVTSREHP